MVIKIIGREACPSTVACWKLVAQLNKNMFEKPPTYNWKKIFELNGMTYDV